jgi:hypothetical protein
MCALLSIQLLSKTFLTLRIIKRDIVVNIEIILCKVPIIFVRLSCNLKPKAVPIHTTKAEQRYSCTDS